MEATKNKCVKFSIDTISSKGEYNVTISKLLLARTYEVYNFGICRDIARIVKLRPKRYVVSFSTLVKSVVTNSGSSLRNHVMLGYTSDGRHMLSYDQVTGGEDLDEDPFLWSTATFTLYWWKIGHNMSTLRMIHFEELFKGVAVQEDLFMAVRETPDKLYVVVQACRDLPVHEATTNQCCMDFLVNPNFPDSADETSFLLTFVKFQSTELVPLHLALAIPDHVIINVGHSVSIICYKNDTTVGLDNLYDMDWLKARKVVIDKDECNLTSVCLLTKPNHSGLKWTIVEHIYDAEVALTQYAKDLQDKIGRCISIKDYDVKLMGVCPLTYCIDILLSAILHTVKNLTSKQFHVQVLSEWNIKNGLFTRKRLAVREVLNSHHLLFDNSSITTDSDKSSIQNTLTNSSVLKGQTLAFLHHPFLPFSVVFD